MNQSNEFDINKMTEQNNLINLPENNPEGKQEDKPEDENNKKDNSIDILSDDKVNVGIRPDLKDIRVQFCSCSIIINCFSKSRQDD